MKKTKQNKTNKQTNKNPQKFTNIGAWLVLREMDAEIE